MCNGSRDHLQQYSIQMSRYDLHPCMYNVYLPHTNGQCILQMLPQRSRVHLKMNISVKYALFFNIQSTEDDKESDNDGGMLPGTLEPVCIPGDTV